jgi:stearoyl-CoA desaturase (delta-9 desaturase)
MKGYSINYRTLCALILFHVAALYALTTITVEYVLWAVLFWFVCGSLGIGIGFRRLISHGSFKTHPIIKYAFITCGHLTLQGGVLGWAARHRYHHAHTDEPGVDVHSPRDGIFWAYVGWVVYHRQELYDRQFEARWARDLVADPVICFLDRWWLLPGSVLMCVCMICGGFTFMLWACIVPVVVVWHTFWIIDIPD